MPSAWSQPRTWKPQQVFDVLRPSRILNSRAIIALHHQHWTSFQCHFSQRNIFVFKLTWEGHLGRWRQTGETGLAEVLTLGRRGGCSPANQVTWAGHLCSNEIRLCKSQITPYSWLGKGSQRVKTADVPRIMRRKKKKKTCSSDQYFVRNYQSSIKTHSIVYFCSNADQCRRSQGEQARRGPANQWLGCWTWTFCKTGKKEGEKVQRWATEKSWIGQCPDGRAVCDRPGESWEAVKAKSQSHEAKHKHAHLVSECWNLGICLWSSKALNLDHIWWNTT